MSIAVVSLSPIFVNYILVYIISIDVAYTRIHVRYIIVEDYENKLTTPDDVFIHFWES